MTDTGHHLVLDNLNLAYMNSYAADSLINSIYTCASINIANAYGTDGMISELARVSNY